MNSVVDDLVKKKVLKTPVIIQAFKKIKRADFVPVEMKNLTELDEPLPIGFGQTISQPYTVAFMLELLEPGAGQKILDVGSGSGWVSALLAQIAGDGGRVFAVERISELCRFGECNAAKYDFIKKERIKFFCQDGTRGLPEFAPFDRIIVAAAGKEIPRVWLDQLKIGGRLVMPVESSIFLLIKKGEKKFETREYPGFAFVPLISEDK